MTPKQIKSIRAMYGLKQVDLAKIFEVSKQTVYNWENGRHEPSRFDVAVLLKLWNMAYDESQIEKAQAAIKKVENYKNENVCKEVFIGEKLYVFLEMLYE